MLCDIKDPSFDSFSHKQSEYIDNLLNDDADDKAEIDVTSE